LLRPHAQLVVISGDSKHGRLSVRVRHLHGNRASLFGTLSPIIRIVFFFDDHWRLSLLASPIFLGLALHRWRVWIFDLEPKR
jgi:hypothetical protein